MLNMKGKLVSLERPVVMGILNVTPDSFFPDSRQQNKAEIRRRIETIISEGAGVIDVGGYSSRPGAVEVTSDDEWRRLEPALHILRNDYPAMPSSIDTFRADLARRAITDYGVSMINDISGGAMDGNMFETVAELNVPYVLTLHQEMDDDRLLDNVMYWFAQKLRFLRQMGVNDVILDPGFGFGKTLAQNYALLRNLNQFSLLFDCPLLVGVSRKSMIYNLLDCTVNDSLNGTTVLNTYSLLHGADILRVHDVKEAVETVRLVEKLKN